MPEGRHEEVDVLRSLPVLGEGSLSQRYRPDPAPVPVLEGLLGAVAAPQPRPLGQYELQLGSGSSSDQGPDQGQGILVEICLK